MLDYVRMNKLLNKLSNCRIFQTPQRPCYITVIFQYIYWLNHIRLNVKPYKVGILHGNKMFIVKAINSRLSVKHNPDNHLTSFDKQRISCLSWIITLCPGFKSRDIGCRSSLVYGCKSRKNKKYHCPIKTFCDSIPTKVLGEGVNLIWSEAVWRLSGFAPLNCSP